MTSSPPGTPGAGIFSLRIVSLDCYMASPIPGLDFSYSDFQGREVEEVPVIRIFGSTPVGQKTCMHVHRALPYLYIPCPEIFLQNSEEVFSSWSFLYTSFGCHAYINVLSLAIEKALSVTNNSASKRRHVHGCNIVRAKRIYGCHMSEELFLKIYLYYPFEVARLATLLLGGAVLNRSFQPYESHIPYLLQFLIDYNLYGMSHVHTSKVKFRPPLPDSFLPAATGCSQQYTSEESSNGAAGSSSVWLSSTVADALIWPVLSTGNNLLEDKIVHLVKRQSVCALEVDSSAEDIVNQGYKMYTSLSQTQSDVKMVQSLIPIWEEEYERSGLQEVTKSPDSSKPLPEHALEHFLYGLEYEKTLSKLSALAHNSSPEVIPAEEEEQLDKYIKCFTDIGQSVRFVEHLMSSNPDEPLRHSKGKVENVSMPSRSFVGEDEHAAAYSKKNGFQGLGSGMRTGDSKVIDTEALGLLNWLASSQAIEELNTDDELVHEAILSPIFPTKSYNQALEMAHLNYESASQQECQDILDTIYDVQKSDGLEEQHPCPSVSISSGNVIPQFDGSFDDQLSLPNEGEISDQNLNGREKYIRHQEGKCSNTMVGAETRTDKLLSGMLPLSPKQKDYEGSRGGTHNSPHEDEMKIDSESRSSGRKHAWSYSASKVGTEVSDGKGGYKMGKCSVRELMRRKRYFRSDQLESQSCFATTSTVMQGNEMMAGYPEWSILHSEERNNHTMPGETVQVEKSHFTEGKFVDKYLQETLVDASSSLDPDHSENQLVADAEDPTTNQDSAIALDELGLCERHFCSDAEQISAVDANIVHPVNQLATSFSPNTLSNVLTEEFSEECTEMTWRRKPPSEGQIDLTSEEFTASVTKAIGVTGDEKQRIRDLPPFFNGKVVDRVQENHTTNKDYAFGVPVHFQNDGTALYLLTYASSPPTSESIQEWLSARIKHNNLRNDTGDFCHTMPPVSYPTQPLISELFQSSQTHRNLEPENCSSHVNVVSSEPRPSCRHMKENVSNSSWHESSQISGPTEKLNLTAVSQIGFRDPASFGGGQQLTIISIEVHAESRGDLQPDPQFDAINVVALAIEEDRSRILDVHVLVCSNDKKPDRRNLDGVKNCNLAIFPEEQQLLRNLLKIIASYDPDILMGWDIQRGSLGFLAERAAYLGISLLKNMSRTPALETDLRFCHPVKFEEGTVGVSSPEKSVAGASLQDVIIEDEWGRNHASGIHVGGRIVLNVWRLMRSELKLNMYTVEAVAEEVLRRKIPSISCRILNNWFLSGLGRARYKCIEYVVERAKLNIQIMNQLDMINRTSELARVFGIDFFSVLSRGSQFRVESMLLRLAHTQNYLALSPGSQQVATQPAMECLPLVMEPESGYYTDPVVVLDFQSLYPSMIIAYNLCFCTCLGKVFPAKANVLGVSSYSVDGKILKEFNQKILLTPNGVMYAPPKVRKGVLPRLLEEILSTRIMVKNAMKKLSPSQKVLQRIFNARQLALKLIANVTYGYTAAGFSGRMPCAELADSIVQCGRSTLETAISFVNNHDKWKAKVVYGDTDSMFVLLKGRSVKEAFRIGNEIAAAITAMNPDPVALKMEKVYHSCFLLTKKRYVGFSYESPDQEEPKFDAKGIETVRRDTCPAVTKTLERSIRIIFEHRSISRVRSYLERQWARILSGKVSLQDFVFAKEVRLDTYSARAASLPPAAIVATKAMRADPRAKPNYGERIPYVVIHGEPGARLIDMVVDPLELLEIDSPFRLNDLYYINKQIIPALQRVFGLVGADLNQWFSEMPRPIRSTLSKSQSYVSHFGSLPNFDDKRFESSKKAVAKSRIDTYYISKHCSLCGELVQASAFVCPNCAKNGSLVVNFVVGKTSKREREMHHLVAICRHCGGDDWIVESGVKCTSLACAVFYERRKVQKELQALSCFATAAGFYPSCMAEKF